MLQKVLHNHKSNEARKKNRFKLCSDVCVTAKRWLNHGFVIV